MWVAQCRSLTTNPPPPNENHLERVVLSLNIHIYIYAVELKTGPIFAFSSVKNWSNFLVFFCFFVFENLILPAEKKRSFQKKEEKQTKKTTFLALKTGPILLRNRLGPVFNASLDQFFNARFFVFFCFFFLFFFCRNPYFL